MQPNRDRFPNYIVLGHWPPHAAICAVLSIIPDHKIVFRRHYPACAPSRRINAWYMLCRMRNAIIRRCVEHSIEGAYACVDFNIFNKFFGDEFAVYRQPLVLITDRITWQTDNTLNIILVNVWWNCLLYTSPSPRDRG